MGTPAKTLILNDIGTTFGTINVAGGYKTNVTKVQALARGYADVKTGERPFLGYVFENEAIQYFAGYIRCTMTVRIIGHVSGQSQSDRASKITNLYDDIVASLSADTTRGANAISTTFTSLQTDEGDPDGRGDGSLLMNCQIIYHRPVTSS
jgi:hypothetical protein